MANPPAFQLYAADFYMDTISWSSEQVGCYLRLLMTEWVNGPLPFEAKKLQKVCQISSKKWPNIWNVIGAKFVLNENGYLINVRLEKTRTQALKYIESQKESGIKGAEKKKKLGLYPFNKQANLKGPLKGSLKQPLKGKVSSSPSSSSSLKEDPKKEPFQLPTKFDYSQLQEKTDILCKTLTGYFKKFNFYAWRQAQINKQKHPEAIQECLELLWKNRKGIKKGPRPYLTQLMKIKQFNPSEKKAIKEHEKRKQEELNYAGDLLGGVPPRDEL